MDTDTHAMFIYIYSIYICIYICIYIYVYIYVYIYNIHIRWLHRQKAPMIVIGIIV
jgi:hypothetical protein